MNGINKFSYIILVIVVALSVIAKTLASPTNDRDLQSHLNALAANQIDSEERVRICRIICKKCPAEGGKACNCDAYALKYEIEAELNNEDI